MIKTFKIIITGEGTLVYGYVETNAHFFTTGLKKSPRPKNARQVPSNVQVMFDFFDCEG
jgi:hypothetical protein